MIFRFDDVCANVNFLQHEEITEYMVDKFPDCKIIWAISIMGCFSEFNTKRVYPKIWNAISDYRQFYKVDRIHNIVPIPRITRASHGLIHIDHRLLNYYAQEMSILTSVSITDSKIFVPPFNKWNKDTEKICYENGIELIKFEDGWKCMEYEKYDEEQELWYLHARDWTLDKVKEWFENSNTPA